MFQELENEIWYLEEEEEEEGGGRKFRKERKGNKVNLYKSKMERNDGSKIWLQGKKKEGYKIKRK